MRTRAVSLSVGLFNPGASAARIIFMMLDGPLEDFVYLCVTKDLRYGGTHWITHMRTKLFTFWSPFCPSFLPFFPLSS
jgi:hypothetical protein